jgi:hypothetical protein
MTERSFCRLTGSLLFGVLTLTCQWRFLFLLPNVSNCLVSTGIVVPNCRLSKQSCRHCRAGDSLHLLKASLETHDESDDNVNKEESIAISSATMTAGGISSACPFSRTFPRYRIDLTTRTRRERHNLSLSILSKLTSPFNKFQRSFQQNLLKQKLFFQQNQASQKNHTKALFLIQPELDGIAAIAFLWEQAANLASTLHSVSNNNNNKDKNDSMIIALPDASPLLVRNFVEIIDWMTRSLPDQFGQYNDDAHLTASLVDTENWNIPTLKLECIRRRPQSRQHTVDKEKEGFNILIEEGIVNTRTRKWVKRILVEQGICPFTKSDRMSGQGLADLGVPVASIAYHTSFQTHAVGLFADTWRAIQSMIQAGPSGKEGVSSILLAAPAFDDDFDYWAGPIFAMLEASVIAAQAESEIGVVCFHPRYATSDGKSWPGFGHMHSVPKLEKWYREYRDSTAATTIKGSTMVLSNLNSEEIAAGGAWQRRTPHATINILRARQLEMAESRRDSAKMYTENIEKLVGIHGIGNDKLALDLEMERQFCN